MGICKEGIRTVFMRGPYYDLVFRTAICVCG